MKIKTNEICEGCTHYRTRDPKDNRYPEYWYCTILNNGYKRDVSYVVCKKNEREGITADSYLIFLEGYVNHDNKIKLPICERINVFKQIMAVERLK